MLSVVFVIAVLAVGGTTAHVAVTTAPPAVTTAPPAGVSTTAQQAGKKCRETF
ncbi:hypothetical protein DPMN_099742 [Dreissena polymorpha]|uniref:Uncharacterized protein n=1 Tax=Dreissena polymorpha TaxID=45954 RepID=A0A9D4LGW9_DREPO|nr:hypothetical protein DPMN_099742 [Dreissena polymorpha]